MDHWMLYGIIGYLILQIAISVVAARFIKSESDYLLAGRSLGTALVAVSVFATWFGAETVIGASGKVAAEGLAGSRGEPLGYTLCLVLMGFLLAGALRARNYITVGDFFADRFGRKVEVLASLIIIPTSLIWAAAQLQAFALILSLVSPLDVTASLLISTAVVVLYTCLGGLLGDVITDVVQGGIIMLGLLVLLLLVIDSAGGASAALASVQPSQLQLVSPGESWIARANVWLIPILGSLVAPEALSRTLAARSEHVARNACFWGAGLYFMVGLLPVCIALAGSHLITPASEVDLFLPTLVKTVMPPWMAVLFLGALISAILSTIDSTLLSIAGLAGHNVILPVMQKNKPASEATKVWLMRSVVLASGVLAFFIATQGKSIYELVELASSFGSAGFLVCMLGGLYAGRISPTGALCVLSAGVLFTLLFELTLGLEGSFIYAVIGCVLVYLAFWLHGRTQIATN